MNRYVVAILCAMGLWSGGAQAQNYHSPEEFFNISPQIGGTTAAGGDLFGGIHASYYWGVSDAAYLGMGVGAYGQGDELVGEALAKFAFVGILGASVGASFSGDGGVSPTNDLWANALIAGVRWRMDHRPAGTIHSVALFVPLGLWIEELK